MALYQIQFVVDGTIYDVGEDVLEYLQEGLSSGTLYQARVRSIENLETSDWTAWAEVFTLEDLSINVNDSVVVQEDISTLVEIVDENLIINVNDEISINDTFVETEILKVLSINVNDSVVVQEFNNQFIDIAFIDTFSINVNDEINVVPNSNVITFATITKSPPYVYIKGDEEWISVRLLINEGPDNWQEKELTCFGG